MSSTRKKVACIILGTSKNIDRLRVLVAGAIKCCNHDLFIKFVADGSRPDFIPKEWEWISAEHLKLTNNNAHPTSRRHAWALESRIASKDYDYCIFCDDDIILDVDKFCQLAQEEEGNPTCWLTEPGTPLCGWGFVLGMVSKHFRCSHLCDIYMAGCVAAVNKKFIELAESERELWEQKLQDWSDEVGTPDLAICLLAGLLKAKVVTAADQACCGGTGWPALVCSSVLCETGQRWFVHGTYRTNLTCTESLCSVLSRAPMDIEKLIPTLYFRLKQKFKAKDFIEKPLEYKFFWCPWHLAGQGGSPTGGEHVLRNMVLNQGGSITENLDNVTAIGKWSPCDDGLWIELENSGRHIFKWTYEGDIVGYPAETKSQNYFGHLVRLSVAKKEEDMVRKSVIEEVAKTNIKISDSTAAENKSDVNVLFVNHFGHVDFLNDHVYEGFIRQPNFKIWETHNPFYMLEGCPDLNGMWGRGIGYGKLKHTPSIEDANIIREKIANRFYDLIVYGSIRRCSDHFSEVTKSYPFDRVLIFDGEDDQGVDLSMTQYGLYFKRELVSAHPKVLPISFAATESAIATRFLEKEQLFGTCVPGNPSTYKWDFWTQKEYYEDYNRSYYGITTKKAGWDCNRHYEILASHCVPYFFDLENCPPLTMTNFPKNQVINASKWAAKKIAPSNYQEILEELFEFTKENMITEKMVRKMILNKL